MRVNKKYISFDVKGVQCQSMKANAVIGLKKVAPPKSYCPGCQNQFGSASGIMVS